MLIFNVVRDPESQSKIFDFIFHLIGTIALLIVGSLLIYSTINIDYYKCPIVENYLYHQGILEWFYGARCQLYEEKLAAGVIAILNGILYGVTGILAMATSTTY
ncbi:unnamed protein product [Allacma fusca]|uniref:Uncharacterized protein n=1 Tax=Allacma fusca TaxID=39272 RepID=A0A8J2KMV9_9HEXA|nr:unnamed protein product [Allacma fusca]